MRVRVPNMRLRVPSACLRVLGGAFGPTAPLSLLLFSPYTLTKSTRKYPQLPHFGAYKAGFMCEKGMLMRVVCGYLRALKGRFRCVTEYIRILCDLYPDSLKSREKFLAFRGSVDSDGA